LHGENIYLFSCFFEDFIYLTERGRQSTSRGEQQAKGEAGSPPSKKPDAGLEPRT